MSRRCVRRRLSHEPYDYFLGSGILKQEAIAGAEARLPRHQQAGLPHRRRGRPQGPLQDAHRRTRGPRTHRGALAEVRAGPAPLSAPDDDHASARSRRTARIHTDGPSKVMTLLVYMNDDWGRRRRRAPARALRPRAFRALAAEVPPTMGTVFAFLRADNSWHGHKPFAGERKVVQVAWVTDAERARAQEEAQQLAQFFKGIFGRSTPRPSWPLPKRKRDGGPGQRSVPPRASPRRSGSGRAAAASCAKPTQRPSASAAARPRPPASAAAAR